MIVEIIRLRKILKSGLCVCGKNSNLIAAIKLLYDKRRDKKKKYFVNYLVINWPSNEIFA